MLSLQKNSSEFHKAPITLIKIFLQGKLLFLIARNPEMIVRCLSSSAVFCGVAAKNENIMRWCL